MCVEKVCVYVEHQVLLLHLIGSFLSVCHLYKRLITVTVITISDFHCIICIFSV